MLLSSFYSVCDTRNFFFEILIGYNIYKTIAIFLHPSVEKLDTLLLYWPQAIKKQQT